MVFSSKILLHIPLDTICAIRHSSDKVAVKRQGCQPEGDNLTSFQKMKE